MGTKSCYSGERRPIASREWRVSQLAADWLVRHSVSANAISIAGMLAGILAGVAFAMTAIMPGWDRLFWLLAALLIQLRLLANMLDGMVAIGSGTASPVGELYNEIPDRVSDAATLIGAGYAAGGEVALGYAGACVAVFTAYIRAMGKTTGAGQEFCGPMAKQQRMFTMTIITLYCGLTPRDWQPAWGPEHAWGLPSAGLLLIVVGGLATALRRLRHIALSLRRTGP